MADDDVPAGSPVAVVGRFADEMQRVHGPEAMSLLRRFAALVSECPAHGRVFLDRLLIEEAEARSIVSGP